jgi:hypothetical protein
MKRILDWMNEPRPGVFYGRRVQVRSMGDGSMPPRVMWTVELQDFDARAAAHGEGYDLEAAWAEGLANFADKLATRERRRIEAASSVERAPHDSERDGRVAE